MNRSALRLESLLTHPEAFGLTKATPCQRAICRIADGEPLGELGEREDVREMISCAPEAMPGARPKEFYLVAAIRGAKSLIAAALGVARALTCDCSPLLDSDVPRVAILAPRIDLADVIFKQHLLGTFARKPKLRALMIGNPNFSDRTFLIRHQSGRPIEIAVVATARAGATVVSRWLVTLIADEFARMAGDASASPINFEDTRRAARERILPGGQIVGISSPWAPFGPAYDVVEKHYGKPTKAVVVLRAPGPSLNPYYWTEDRIAKVSAAPDGDTILQTDCWARFADPAASFFTEAELKAVTRDSPTARLKEDNTVYYAFMDPATRRNAWTLIIVGATWNDDGYVQIHVAFCRQWLPTAKQKLKPRDVLLEIKDELAPYGLTEVGTDQWSSDAIADIGELEGLTVTEHTCAGPESLRRYDALRAFVRGGQLELAPMPELRRDLLAIQRKTTREGFAIVLRVTADGRHADYAPALRGAVHLASETGPWVHAMKKVDDRLKKGGTVFSDQPARSDARIESVTLHYCEVCRMNSYGPCRKHGKENAA